MFSKKRFHLYFSTIEAYITVYITNLLTLVIWKCVCDRIVYIVKKCINIFQKRSNVAKGGTTFFCAPPPHTNALVRPCNKAYIYPM